MTRSTRASQTATTRLVGKVNRTVIVELLRDHGPLTYAAIAAMSGLSAATTRRLVAALAREGLVLVDAVAPSTGGRPAQLIRRNPRVESVVVVDVRADDVVGAVADLDATFVARAGRAVSRSAAETRVHDVVAFVCELIAESHAHRLRVRGVAIGVPGVVRPAGLVEWAPILGWREVPLGDLVTAATGVPAFVENDVNLFALGEHRRGAGRDARSMVAIAIESGLGGGVIVDGELHRGAHSAAGEVGYLLTGTASLARFYPVFGDLESRIAGSALARRAAAIGYGGGSDVDAVDALLAAEPTDPAAAAIVDDLVDSLAVAAGNVGVLLDPDLVVVGGSVIRPIDAIVDRVARRLVGRVPHPPRLAAAALGADAVLVGGAALAVERTADDLFVRAADRAAG